MKSVHQRWIVYSWWHWPSRIENRSSSSRKCRCGQHSYLSWRDGRCWHCASRTRSILHCGRFYSRGVEVCRRSSNGRSQQHAHRALRLCRVKLVVVDCGRIQGVHGRVCCRLCSLKVKLSDLKYVLVSILSLPDLGTTILLYDLHKDDLWLCLAIQTSCDSCDDLHGTT